MERVLSVVACVLALFGASFGSMMDSKLNKVADALINDLGDDGMSRLEKFLHTMSGSSMEKAILQDEDDPSSMQGPGGDNIISNEMMSKLANLMADVDDGKMMEGDDDDTSLLSQALIQDDEPLASTQRRYVRIRYKVWCVIRRFYWYMYRRFGRRWRG